MINKETIIFILLVTVIALVLLIIKPNLSLAEELNIGSAGQLINTTAGQAQISRAKLPAILAEITKALLGLVGAIFFILILYGGFKWMTAGGNDENIKKAKKLIVSAVIGLAIVTAAYSIAYFISSAIETASQAATT